MPGIEDDVFLELLGEGRLGQQLLRDRFHQGLQRFVDHGRLDAHGQGQRPAGHVVRQFGLGLEVFADVGIALFFKDVLDEGAVGLGQGYDIGPFVEQAVADPDRVGELEYPDIGLEQHLDEALGRGRVVLLARDDVGVRRFARAAGDVFAGDLEGVEQQLVFLARRQGQDRERGLEVVAGPGRKAATSRLSRGWG